MALGALLSACASERVQGVAVETLSPPPEATGPCRFALSALQDRRSQTDLGQLVHTRVDGRGFVDWLESGLRAMPGHVHHDAQQDVRVEVLKAYVDGLGTLKSAHLVVRVASTQVDGRQSLRIYRGADHSMNWNSTQSEIQSAFDRALQDLQRQLSADLGRACLSS